MTDPPRTYDKRPLPLQLDELELLHVLLDRYAADKPGREAALDPARSLVELDLRRRRRALVGR